MANKMISKGLSNGQTKQVENKRGKHMEYSKSSPNYVSCCSVCKRIRGSDGYWHRIPTTYMVEIAKRLTHGFCELCFKQFMKSI